MDNSSFELFEAAAKPSARLANPVRVVRVVTLSRIEREWQLGALTLQLRKNVVRLRLPNKLIEIYLSYGIDYVLGVVHLVHGGIANIVTSSIVRVLPTSRRNFINVIL